MTQKINHEQIVFETSIFTVKQVNLSSPDGGSHDYALIDIQNAVTILPIDDDGNVYFVRQYRIGAKKELLELPAGKIEKDEDPLETAQREIREETGMAASEMIQLGSFYMTPGYATEYMYGYLARGLHSDPLAPDSDEYINVIRIPISEVRHLIANGVIEDSKTLAVFMLADHILNADSSK